MTADELRAVVARDKQTAATAEALEGFVVSRTSKDRGALLRHMRALAKPVPYRPGLPSVEQVRAHEERGGWWHRLLIDDPTPMTSRLFVRDDVVMTLLSSGMSVRSRGAKYRPCLPNNDACAWPGEPDPWAALEALR